jgi:hypothetical protein
MLQRRRRALILPQLLHLLHQQPVVCAQCLQLLQRCW